MVGGADKLNKTTFPRAALGYPAYWDPSWPVPGLTFSVQSCGKSEFGQISRSFSLHAARLYHKTEKSDSNRLLPQGTFS